ncbi:hypothetical protein AXY34_06245 [Mammaliicoccus lentus]|nr:hypothetical protein AXY34_06245 [Mammaliicoccus lentus]
MMAYSTSEISEALNTINATITNCEKMLGKFDENTSQHSLLINRIQALKTSKGVITSTEYYDKIQLEEALPPIESIINKSSKAQIKHNKESSTYKRLQKHIHAMKVAQFFIYADLKNK